MWEKLVFPITCEKEIHSHFSPKWKISCLQHHLMNSPFFTTDLQWQFCHVLDFNICRSLSDILFFVSVYLSSHYHISCYIVHLCSSEVSWLLNTSFLYVNIRLRLQSYSKNTDEILT